MISETPDLWIYRKEDTDDHPYFGFLDSGPDSSFSLHYVAHWKELPFKDAVEGVQYAMMFKGTKEELVEGLEELLDVRPARS